MTQTELAFDVPNRLDYPPGFFQWVVTEEGQAIWEEFDRMALEMAQKRTRYSASAIAQVIRWFTLLQDGTEFKLNNNWIPGLARLWMAKHGRSHPNFFQLRDQLGRNKNACD